VNITNGCILLQVEENRDYFPPKTDALRDDETYQRLLSELNESQKKAICACLSSFHCKHKSTVDLICGPPGAGKTKTLSTLLFALFKMNCRTLVCAPTNVAIKEVASGGLSMVRDLFEFCYLGDMLLFGNHDSEEIEEIYLDYRVKQLMLCFNSSNGWKYCFTSMIDLLKNCFSHYQIFIENQTKKEQVQTDDNNSNTAKDDSPSDSGVRMRQSFVEFFREKFQTIALPLKKCIYILRTHIARSCIMEHNLDGLARLKDSLDLFEALMSDSNIVSQRLAELLYPPEIQDSSSESDVASAAERSLLQSRTKCISLLTTLQVSLGDLKLPDVATEVSIREFCLGTASLILSSASSSFMLHYLDMKPLDVLVIDEAEQLRECESIIPLLLPEINHAVLIGDEHQQPSTVRIPKQFTLVN
jgi:senataxin